MSSCYIQSTINTNYKNNSKILKEYQNITCTSQSGQPIQADSIQLHKLLINTAIATAISNTKSFKVVNKHVYKCLSHHTIKFKTQCFKTATSLQ